MSPSTSLRSLADGTQGSAIHGFDAMCNTIAKMLKAAKVRFQVSVTQSPPNDTISADRGASYHEKALVIDPVCRDIDTGPSDGAEPNFAERIDLDAYDCPASSQRSYTRPARAIAPCTISHNPVFVQGTAADMLTESWIGWRKIGMW